MRLLLIAIFLFGAPLVGRAAQDLKHRIDVCTQFPTDKLQAECLRKLSDELSGKRAPDRPAPKTGKLSEEQRLGRDVDRARLRDVYLGALEKMEPSMNHMQVRIVGSGDKVGLFGNHPFFSRRSFDLGRLGPAVQDWINFNRPALEKAGIDRIGVMDRDNPESRAWYTLK